MAEIKPYSVGVPAEDAAGGIRAGFAASKVAGILYGDGQGGVRAAKPGEDYGFPLLQGNGPPAGSTVASLGQHYFDMTATKPPYEYICVGYTAFGFVWTVYGDPGAGFQVLGRFSNLEALEAAVAEGLVPRPSPGDAYFIGNEAPYNMYFWDIMTQSWAYYGPLGGAGVEDLVGIPPHGDAGQVLKKLSDADFDVAWGEAVPDGSIDAAKLAKGAVESQNISPGAVGLTELADDTKAVAFTVQLPASGWINNRQTVNNGLFKAAGFKFDVAPAPVSFAVYGKSQIYAENIAADGELTFVCKKQPSEDLTVNIGRTVVS